MNNGEKKAADDSGVSDGTARRMLRLGAALMRVAPHVHVDGRELIWADARGLSASQVAESVLAVATRHAGEDIRVGVARTPIVAEIAARDVDANANRMLLVRPGTDREFLASYPLSILEPYSQLPRLLPTLADVGLETVGEFARLTSEAVEVRFGGDAVALWKLARADDPRLIFTPMPRALPSASLEWEEYVLRDTERLLFVANNLADTVCAGLRAWGETARSMTVSLQLSDRTTLERCVRTASATASRATWLRLIRAELERTKLPDAVTGISLRVDAASALEAPQGDLFDAGFQSARAVESALAQLLDDKQAMISGLATTAHPLVERRAVWSEQTVSEALRVSERRPPMSARPVIAVQNASAAITSTMLSLQLWPRPKMIAVQTEERRGCKVPVAYREGSEMSGTRGRGGLTPEIKLLEAAGPDRICSDDSGAPYSREYFHALNPDGTLVLLYRDVAGGGWYLHGWWD